MSRAVPLSQAREARAPQAAHGACACGSVRYAVRLAGEVPTRCICARCRGLDLRILTVPRAQFRLLTGREDLTEPLSDARTPHHFFCSRCGEAGFGFPGGPDGPVVTVNAAWIDRGDPAAVEGQF